MPAPTSARRHYRRLQRLKALLLASTRRSWRRMEPRGSWERQYATIVGPQVNAIVTAAQVTATRESDAYVAEVLNELDFGPRTEPGVVREQSLAGYAGDGRPIDTLLATSVGRARAVAASTGSQEAGLDAGEAFMDMVAQTLLEDAMREAELVAMVQRPWVDGFVRMINPPCCSRCAVLSGRFYLFSEGFPRHPRCDCYHLPAPSDPDKVRDLIAINSPDRYFDSLSESEQDKVFTRAGAQAIREGADIGRVVNARRGMSTVGESQTRAGLTAEGLPTRLNVSIARAAPDSRGRLTTTEGTTRRGRLPGQKRGPRLMPETILVIAGDDRAEALRLLRENGYIL